MVLPEYESSLSPLINRSEVGKAQDILQDFVDDWGINVRIGGKLCPTHTQPIMSEESLTTISKWGEYDDRGSIMERYFQLRGVSNVGCCGSPLSYSLPGLSAAKIFIVLADDTGEGNVCAGALAEGYYER